MNDCSDPVHRQYKTFDGDITTAVGATESLFDPTTGAVKRPLLAALTRTFAPAVAVAGIVPVPPSSTAAPAPSKTRTDAAAATAAAAAAGTGTGTGIGTGIGTGTGDVEASADTPAAASVISQSFDPSSGLYRLSFDSRSGRDAHVIRHL